MNVEVEIQYTAMPSQKEMAIVRNAAQHLTSQPETVSAYVDERDRYYAIVLEFTMQPQVQYQAVDKISDVIEPRINRRRYHEMVVRFPQTPAYQAKYYETLDKRSLPHSR